METRGFAVDIAESVAEGIAKAKTRPPKYAVVDLRLGDGSGLDVIEAIRTRRDDTRIIMLDRLWKYRHRRQRGETGGGRLSRQAR